MKILWIINLPLPEVSKLRGLKQSPFGGWLVNASIDLALSGVELSIAYPCGSKEVIKTIGQEITYYSFSDKKNSQRKLLNSIIVDSSPQLVHIFGTEYSHSLAASELAKEKNIPAIVSIQGLVSFIEKHLYANLPPNVLKGKSIRNHIFRDNIMGLKSKFIRRGLNEVSTLNNVDHIIGRTTWDRAASFQINPNAKYHFCNETLRESFYNSRWDIDRCDPYSIFLSQSSYSIKGLHYMLEALPTILKQYPKTKLYIAGNDIAGDGSLKSWLKRNYYDLYIKKLINKYSLKNVVIFTGLLNENEMSDKFLKSNVFVCPSSIENSPNSLGEAMILGVPTISSYVGGVPDMLEHDVEGYLYQADAPYMLAHYVCEIFGKPDKTVLMSKNAINKALVTHNKTVNTAKLIEIYREILLTK